MLFNSYIFVLLFLPLCLVGWFSLNRLPSRKPALLFLLGMSLWFYGYFNPKYIPIILCCFHIPLCVADISGGGNAVFFQKGADGRTLVRTCIAEAQVAGNQPVQAQLADAQLRVALLAVADDEQPVGFGECAEGFRNARVADAAFVFFQVAVFPRHAALHQGIAHLGRHIREKRIGNGGHDLA